MRVSGPMQLKITEISPASAEIWNAIWRDCDYATYFHSREWADLWSTYTQGQIEPAPKLVRLSDGTRVLLPLSRRRSRNGLVKTHLASPGGTFGGWLSAVPLGDAHLAVLLDLMLRRIGDLVWRWNPYAATSTDLAAGIGEPDETHVLDLSPGFEALFRGWTKGHRSAVRKAEKSGVTARLATSPADWQHYDDLYRRSLQRWGEKATTVYEPRFFEALARLQSPGVRLWLAFYADQAVAGALVLYAKRHAVYWHGAADERHFHLRPVNLLLYAAIQDACRRGFRWFDFNPSGGQQGVVSFKRSFGAQARACPLVRRRSLRTRVVGRLAGLAVRPGGQR
jgi:CelD/BcsL family acetyltransferase involved in cellulose biosynthesis